ncbi:MAG: hypothetical protein QXG12_06345 [Thermoproteota archaeon]
MTKPNTIIVKVPAWISGDRVMEDVERLLEEKYGVVSVGSLRKKFKIKSLREDVEVSEREILALRESEKKRLQDI